MLWLEQLELRFFNAQANAICGRDSQLEKEAHRLLVALGGRVLARSLQVTWSSRLRSAAGRADFRHNIVSLNPRLKEYGVAEIDHTLRHELAHLLAHFRCGRRRIAPHGVEWQQACVDLGIRDESRCHTLPFPIAQRARRYLYRCPRCARTFPRVRRIRRAVACLACCRAYNGGKYEPSAQLRLVNGPKISAVPAQ